MRLSIATFAAVRSLVVTAFPDLPHLLFFDFCLERKSREGLRMFIMWHDSRWTLRGSGVPNCKFVCNKPGVSYQWSWVLSSHECLGSWSALMMRSRLLFECGFLPPPLPPMSTSHPLDVVQLWIPSLFFSLFHFHMQTKEQKMKKAWEWG